MFENAGNEKSEIGLVLLPCDSVPWQWAGVTSPASHWRSVKSKKIPSQVSVRGSCFLLWACVCPGLGVKFHIHLLLSFCDCVAGCWVKYCSLCWLLSLLLLLKARHKVWGGGWFCFIFACFWAVSLWSFLIIWISCSSFIKFFWHWRKKCFFILLFLVALALCKEEPLHYVWCLPVSTYNLAADSSFGSRFLQLSTLYGSEGICCRATLRSRKCIYVLVLCM